jgi:hypothetical protein
LAERVAVALARLPGQAGIIHARSTQAILVVLKDARPALEPGWAGSESLNLKGNVSARGRRPRIRGRGADGFSPVPESRAPPGARFGGP